MKPIFAILIIASVAGTLGCSMCCGVHDYDYPTYGGVHQRVDPTYGRVGSLFSDPNASNGGESADSNLAEPTPLRSNETKQDKQDDADAEADIEKFKKELESISPKENVVPKPGRGGNGSKTDELPPPDAAGKDPTAQRLWQRRSQQQGQWR